MRTPQPLVDLLATAVILLLIAGCAVQVIRCIAGA